VGISSAIDGYFITASSPEGATEDESLRRGTCLPFRGADGRTPYERSARKPWRLKLPEFGEGIWYQPLKGEKEGSKLEPKFERGIFLGVQEGSAPKWIGTNEGVVRAWSVKRRPEAERWVVDDLNLYSWKLGCELANAVYSMAPGESLRICHDLRGLLALGKGDRWSWLSPWVLQW